MTGWRSPPPEPAPAAPRRRLRALPVVIVVLAVAVAAGVAVKLTGGGGTAADCQSSFVPAFFVPQDWKQAAPGGTGPSVMILNPASGPGSAPLPAFKTAVKRAIGTGSHIIGYIGTGYGRRPLAEAETEIRDYRDWYGVTGIFLDQTPTGGTQQIGYYQQLARFIHRADAGAAIWLNPGVYPAQSYMSVGTVVMVFEGSYASYLGLKVPAWARNYPASRFAHTIYATPQADLGNAVRLARNRNAGNVFVTDDVGANPYSAVPTYWSREQATVAGDCAQR